MPDIFANITAASDEQIAIIANVLELRATLPENDRMLSDYLTTLEIQEPSRVLEIGCGTGPVCRFVARWPGVQEIIGVDPSEGLLEKAWELSSEFANITYEIGDGKQLRFENESFDYALLHTVLTHVPDQLEILQEAHRVLKNDGRLVICDGDFSTASLAIGPGDSLEACTEAFVEGFVNDPWLVRKLPQLAQQAGFTAGEVHSYGFMQQPNQAGLMSTWVERGADALLAGGRISETLANELKAEGKRRVEEGIFFGYMAYATMICSKRSGQ